MLTISWFRLQSIPVAAAAATWNVFAIIVVIFPSDPDPDANTMNYTVAVGGGWIGLCIMYYFFPRYGGRYWFTGPVTNIQHERQHNESLDIVEVKEIELDEKGKKYL